jgi:hypothetical protein
VKKRGAQESESPAQKIDARIEQLSDWRGKALKEVRRLINEAEPEIIEEWKWQKPSNPGIPVWSYDGGICTGETYKDKVKLTFFRGADLEDPAGIFNSSLDGKVRRAIDLYEGEKIDEQSFKALIRAAVALNKSKTQR